MSESTPHPRRPAAEGGMSVMKRLLFRVFLAAVRALRGFGLTRIPGVRVCYELLYRLLVPSEIVSIDCQGSRMFVDASDRGVVPFLVKGVHEEPQTRLFRSLVGPGMTVLDVGANVGYFSLIAAREMKGKGRIYAFEPLPVNFELLRKNAEVNGYGTITAVPLAVSDREERVECFVDRWNSGGSSLSSANMPESDGSITVETTSLDRWFEHDVGDLRVDLIKADTQGAEARVIEGARRIIGQNDLKIIMEFWPFGLENLGCDPLAFLCRLEELGFSVSLIGESGSPSPVTDFPALVARCAGRTGGRGDEIIFLEKPHP
jgi:FkbM family methyltransferase